jgi:soluble lytic murein transglycosylase-like protein
MEIVSDLNAVMRRVRAIAELTPTAAPTPVFEEFMHGALGRLRQASAPLPSPAIERIIAENARASGLDPALIEAVVANESGFDPMAHSSAGAEGLMQLMPGTAASLGVNDPYDAAQNIWGGTRYLHALLRRFGGSLERAVAAYNAGPAAVAKYGGVPPYAQTKAYVRNVIASLQRYKAQRLR